MNRRLDHLRLTGLATALLAVSAFVACSASDGTAPPPAAPVNEAPDAAPSVVPDAGQELVVSDASDDGSTRPFGDPVDVPIDGVTAAQLALFSDGDALFGLPLREADGLGPLYTRAACNACHEGGARGPGLVQKMAVVAADGFTPAVDQSKLAFGHTVHPLLAAGAVTPILPPTDDPTVKVSIRVGPPVLGRGYMEAVLDSEIERVASEQAARSDAIHGRVNTVIYGSEANPDTSFHTHKKGDSLIGRFGAKARIGTLDDFVADAMQGDMGITSPLRPEEFANPDGLLDDKKPGIDATADQINLRANYMRLIAIPKRSAANPQGVALFDQAKCSACHVPSLKTRADYPISQLANIDAPIFTDFLLHDMGKSLSDSLPDGVDQGAHARDWRTAPLIGLRFDKTFMHDSRAHSVQEAIVAHDANGADTDSEAHESAAAFRALSDADRQTLLEFVTAL